jgi:hypothetical protein
LDPEYTPGDFEIREPSKYKTDVAEMLIAHWRERVAEQLIPLAFKAYKAKDGSLVRWVAPRLSLDGLIGMPTEDGLDGEFA